MLNAVSREIRSIRAQENIGVHRGAPLLVEHFPKKSDAYSYMARSSSSVYGPISKLIRGPTTYFTLSGSFEFWAGLRAGVEGGEPHQVLQGLVPPIRHQAPAHLSQLARAIGRQDDVRRIGRAHIILGLQVRDARHRHQDPIEPV